MELKNKCLYLPSRHPMMIDDTKCGLGIRNTLKCGTVIWRCSYRPKINSCPGLVPQVEDKFAEKRAHTCKAKQHLKINTILSARVKTFAIKNVREALLKSQNP